MNDRVRPNSGHRQIEFFQLKAKQYEVFRRSSAGRSSQCDLHISLENRFDANDAVTEHIERLSPEARLVYLVWCLDGEIHNGGFDKFFYNSLGDHWSELLSHLDTIGAVTSKRLLAQAVSIFPDSAPSTNRQERSEQLNRLDDAEVEALLSDLDEEFWRYEDNLAQRVNDFVMKHPNATIAVGDD